MTTRTSPEASPRSAFIGGVTGVAPILLGVIPFGMIYGVLAIGAGLSAGAAQAMSSVVFAGSAQFVATGLFKVGAPGVVLVLTTLIVNLRHVLYSASVAPYLKHLSWKWKLLLAYLLTDEAYAVAIMHYNTLADTAPSPRQGEGWDEGGNAANSPLTLPSHGKEEDRDERENPADSPLTLPRRCSAPHPAGSPHQGEGATPRLSASAADTPPAPPRVGGMGGHAHAHWYFLGAGLGLWLTWQISTGVGIMLGAQIPGSWALDFTLALTFIALVVPALKDRPSLAAALAAGAVAVAAASWPYKLGLMAAALTGIVVGLFLDMRQSPAAGREQEMTR